jgi:hypothetical protein
VLAPLAFLEHRRSPIPVTGPLIATGVLAGSAFVVASFLQQSGLITASVTNTAFLTALYVVATPFIGFTLTRSAIPPLVCRSGLVIHRHMVARRRSRASAAATGR